MVLFWQRNEEQGNGESEMNVTWLRALIVGFGIGDAFLARRSSFADAAGERGVVERSQGLLSGGALPSRGGARYAS